MYTQEWMKVPDACRVVLRVTPGLQDEKRNISAVLGRLKEPQLEGLVRAVETQGAVPGPCCQEGLDIFQYQVEMIMVPPK